MNRKQVYLYGDKNILKKEEEMRNKILRVFLAIAVALPMFTSVFAVSYNDLIARLDGIAEDINSMKQEYDEILNQYPEVIDSLSAENKNAALDLANNLMADGNASALESIKAELLVSTTPDADKVLDSIQDLETKASNIINDNKDIVEEVKGGYSDLTISEIKQVVGKVTDIAKSLGVDADVSDTYNKMLIILEEAHDIATNINIKLDGIISGNAATFESALTLDLVKELFNEVKLKDEEAVIDTLIEALNKAEGGTALKEDLKEVKAIAGDLKDKLMELDNLSEQDLLMFTDDQKAGIANKLKSIEKDYIDFAKVILDTYSQDYMDIVINLAYNETVDKMIDYANEALDYYEEYKDTVDSLSTKDIMARLNLPEELMEKAGLMVALGFVDTTNYNKDYVKETFKTQIDDMSEYVAEEFVDYLDHIDSTINNEVMYKYLSGEAASKVQNDLRTITASRFTTLTNLKSLKTRVDTVLLTNKEDIKSDVNKIADYVYDIYNENILTSVAATLMKENDEATKKYETHGEDGYILTNKFISQSDFTSEMGIPVKHANVVKYSNLTNSKIKTGASFTLSLSDTSIIQLTFAVLGDVFADGMVDARDYMVIKNYIMDGEKVSAISLLSADTYRDDVIDARDYMVIKNLIMDNVEITL